MSNDIDNTAAAEIKSALADMETALEAKHQEYEAQIKSSGDATNAVKSDLRKMSEDYESVLNEVKKAQDAVLDLKQRQVKIPGEGKQPKTLGQRFVESDSFASYRDGASSKARLEVKNTISGETGGTPTNDIVPLQTMPGIVGGAFRMLRIIDITPTGTASGNTVHYTKETTWTNAAAETAEAATKPESTLEFTGVDSPVRTIAHFLKVTRQVIDDAPALQSYIDTRMRHGLENRLDSQIINGDGVAPNLSGILATGNHTDPGTGPVDETVLDFANRIKYEVIASDYMPNAYILNPADWGAIEILKSTTGAYLGSINAIGYINNGLTPTLWGLPVVISNNMAEGQMICMATDATMYWDRQSAVVEIFDQNEDDVKNNLLTVRGELRGAYSVFRAAAIVAGTIPTPAATTETGS